MDDAASRDAEFRHPRLVEIYDLECPWGRDDDWFVARVREVGATRVLDFGCGTGRLATGLAARGFEVTGVDPAVASLAAARARPGAEACRWIEGGTDAIPEERWDAVVMSSHVAQFLVDDAQFTAHLARLQRALAPGGHLFFDSRDPDDAIWLRWTPEHTRRAHTLRDGVSVQAQTSVQRAQACADGCIVDFVHTYRCSDGATLRSASTLRFRSRAALVDHLAAAGFEVLRIDGGWDGEAPGAEDGELLVRARAR